MLFNGFADNFVDLGIKNGVGMGRSHDEDCIGSPACACNCYNGSVGLYLTGIGSHRSYFNAYLCALPEHSEGIGHYFGGIYSAESAGHRSFCAAENMSGCNKLESCCLDSALLSSSISLTPGVLTP